MKLPRLSENFFSEDTHGSIYDHSLDFLNYDWFSEHAIGYYIPDTKSKYCGLVLIMFEYEGELCWFTLNNETLIEMNAELC